MAMKRIFILGSTGSIGINTLNVIERFPNKFKVVGLSAHNNCSLLISQIKKFNPKYIGIGYNGIDQVRQAVAPKAKHIFDVAHDLTTYVTQNDVDVVVIGLSGFAALKPFMASVKAGKTVAPANKEALIVAGHILMRAAKKNKAFVIPIDSEQSAIFQCLEGRDPSQLQRVLLTASGGSLKDVAASEFDKLGVDEILRHPRWHMGRKITVDSATLMNKGFEVIEAQRLFNLKADQIEVVVHPQAIIHSMVELKDTSIIAQLGVTDMRLPIQYALSYPERWASDLPRVDFFALQSLIFERPDEKKFPCLNLAKEVARKGGTYPCALVAADEEAVAAFLEKKIALSDIYRLNAKVIDQHRNISSPSLTQIFSVHEWAVQTARDLIKSGKFNKQYI